MTIHGLSSTDGSDSGTSAHGSDVDEATQKLRMQTQKPREIFWMFMTLVINHIKCGCYNMFNGACFLKTRVYFCILVIDGDV